MATYKSVNKVIQDLERWFRLATFLHEPLKEALLNVFHNLQYGGLPRDPVGLYNELDKKHGSKINFLKKRKILQDSQYQLIFPPNQQETFSEKFDVTLLVILIRNCLQLLPKPMNGWDDKNPPLIDQSVGANVVRAREWRNYVVHHEEPEDIDTKNFTDHWNKGVAILQGLHYVYDTNKLKTASFDPKQGLVLASLETYLDVIKQKQKAQEITINNFVNENASIVNQQATFTAKSHELETKQADLEKTATAKLQELETKQADMAKTVDVKSQELDSKQTELEKVQALQAQQIFATQNSNEDALKEFLSLKIEIEELKKDAKIAKRIISKKLQPTEEKKYENVVTLSEDLKDLKFTIACKFENGIVMKFCSRYTLEKLQLKRVDCEAWSVHTEDSIQRSSTKRNSFIRVTGLNDGNSYDFKITLRGFSKHTENDHVSYVELRAVKIPNQTECHHINKVGGFNMVYPSFGDSNDLFYFCDDILDGDVMQPEDKLSFQLAEGAAVQTIDMKSFVDFGKRYFFRNKGNHETQFQFPPQWMISDSRATKLVSCFMGMLSNIRGLKVVLSGYSCAAHYRLFKNSKVIPQDDDFTSKHRSVLVFCSELNLILHIQLCSIPELLEECMKRCRDNMRAFIRLHHYAIQSEAVSILGIVYCSCVSYQQSKEFFQFYFPSESALHHNLFFLYNEDLSNPLQLQEWWEQVLVPFLRTNLLVQDGSDGNGGGGEFGIFPSIIGSCMAVMAATDFQLPSLSNVVALQLATLVLTHEQYETIHSRESKKIIYGCFGSGKSVVGKQIVKELVLKEGADSTLVYACVDKYSLLECEMQNYVEELLKSEHPEALSKVICGSFLELCKKIKMDGEVTLSKFLDSFSSHCTTLKVHFVLEEVPGDLLTEEESKTLRELYRSRHNKLFYSKVVFLMQSVEKTRNIKINREQHEYKANCLKLTEVKKYELTKIMRNSNSISRLIRLAQKDVSLVTMLPTQKKSIKESFSILIKKYTTMFSQSSKSTEKSRSKETTIDSPKLGSSNREETAKDSGSEGNQRTISQATATESASNASQIANISSQAEAFDTPIEDLGIISSRAKSLRLSKTNVIETHFNFLSGTFGHGIVGERPRVICLPDTKMAINMPVILSIVLDRFGLVHKGKVTVLCNNLKDCQHVAHAVDMIKGNIKYKCYMPSIKGTIATFQEKKEVWRAFQGDCNVLITDSRGFRGNESKNIVVVSTTSAESSSLHLFVESLARCTMELTVITTHTKKEPSSNGSISEVVGNWLHNDIVDLVDVTLVKDLSCAEQLTSRKDGCFVINTESEAFLHLLNTVCNTETFASRNNLVMHATETSMCETFYKKATSMMKKQEEGQPSTYSDRNEVDENVSMEDLKLVHKLPTRYSNYDTYKAEWKNMREESVVVLAKIFSLYASDEDKDIAIGEVNILKAIGNSCPYVVGLLGYRISDKPIVLQEFCENDSLGKFMRRTDTAKFSKLRLPFACDVAKGMVYVTERRIIHSNLCLLSIFVSINNQCKIGGFMNAAFIDDLTDGDMRSTYSEETLEKSDVYLFGLLLWNMHSSDGIKGTNFWQKRPPGCSDEMHGIILKCCRKIPDTRPTFKELVVTLERLILMG